MMKTDDYCFVCGRENPKGLKAVFNYKEGYASCEIILSHEYQGWSGIIHGGILSCLLDEACVYAANSLGYNTVTAELKIRFRKEASPGEKILVEATATHLKSKLIQSRAKITNSHGETLAEAEGKMIIKENRE